MATSLWSQKSCVCNLPSVPRKACWAKSGSCIRKHIRCKQISSRSGKALVLQCGVEPQEVVNVPRADDVRLTQEMDQNGLCFVMGKKICF